MAGSSSNNVTQYSHMGRQPDCGVQVVSRFTSVGLSLRRGNAAFFWREATTVQEAINMEATL